MSREDCIVCRRPMALCFCASITTVPHRTGITVVQHPRERHHPFNTLRLARRALSMDVHIAWSGTLERPALPSGTALLFPTPEAVALDALPTPPTHLVAIDGTWPQAKAVYRATPWMQALPTVVLAPTEPSTYRIRKEPQLHCLSTIESLVAALQACEPDNTGLNAALQGFHAMVDGQIAHRATTTHQPRHPKRTGDRLPLRKQLDRFWDHTVAIYAEIRRDPEGRPEVLQLAAQRTTGETFDVVVRPTVIPNSCVLAHLELTGDTLAAGIDPSELGPLWRDWCQPTDRLISWSPGAAELALSNIGLSTPVWSLKSIYCNARPGPCGTPDTVREREGIPRRLLPFSGRASERLANAIAIAGWLADPT